MALNISVDLTPKQVEEAISYWLQSQGLNVKSTRFEASMQYDYMDRGPGSPAFSGAKVQVEPQDKSRSYSSLGSQIADVESRSSQFGDH